MKNSIFFLIVISLSSCFNKKPEKTGFEGKPMPSFNLLLTDSITNINTTNIGKGQPIVLVFMSPYCPFCKTQTEEILDNIKLLNNIKVYFITSFPLNSLKEYYKHYEFNKYTNIVVARDYDSYFEKYFNVTTIPYTAIYDKDKLLKQVLIGKTSINLIKDIALR